MNDFSEGCLQQPVADAPRLQLLATIWGTAVRARVADGVAVHSVDCPELYTELYAYQPLDGSDVIFLLPSIALGKAPIYGGALWLGAARPLRRLALPGGRHMALIDPVSGLYVSARERASPADREGELHWNATSIGFWEAFHFAPSPSPSPAQPCVDLAELAAPNLRPQGCGSPLATALDRAVMSYDAVQAWGGLLRQDEIAATAGELAGRLNERGAPQEDIHAVEVLPRLKRWLAGRRTGEFPRQVGPAFDGLDDALFDRPLVSLAGRCTVALRGKTLPRRRLAILATVRNEGLYLVEWLAYHRAVGVEAIFVYANDNDDGSTPMLEALAAAGVIYLLHNVLGPGARPQFKAYGHALQALPELLDFEWVAAIDADEFIRFDPTRYASLDDFLRWHDALGSDAIALSWLVHTPAGRTHYAPGDVQERFPNADLAGDAHVKSLFRPRRFVHAHCHFPVAPPGEARRFRTANGSAFEERQPFNSAPDYQHAWIAHYFYKSLEEYMVRRTRARADATMRDRPAEELLSGGALLHLMAKFDYSERAPPLEAGLARRAAEESDALWSIIGVREAFVACQARFAAEAADTRKQLAASPRFQVFASAEASLLYQLEQAENRSGGRRL